MADRSKILVVDDNALLRNSLSQQLGAAGYEVNQAACGSEALSMIKGGSYRLILLDLRMPYVDGFEVLTIVKDTLPNTRVIVVTAYNDLTTVQKCRKLGADEIIGKPFNIEYLFHTIELMLKK